MGFNGDLYPEAGASVVMSTKGDIVRYDSQRERYGIGSANQILQVKSGLPSWETLSTAGSVLTTRGDILYEDASGLQRLAAGTAGKFLTTQGTSADPTYTNPTLSFIVSLTAEDGDLTVADDLAQIRMPFAFTLTEVRAFVNTAPVGASLTFDIEQGGSTILTTLISIDAGDTTSEDATTPPVINVSALTDDAIISFNCDQIGSSTAGAGGKIMLIGYETV